MDAGAAVEVRGLSKSYRARAALTAVDLTVTPGTVHALVGPNGAGKTTLLRVLLGLARPDSGDITVLGRVRGLRGVAGFVEAPRFPPELTARQVLRLLGSYDAPDPVAAASEVLERVGLTERAHDRVGGFSVGLRQRLGLAACLLRRPRLLLLDEPTSGLDPSAAQSTRTQLVELAAAGIAVLVSSHDLVEVSEICGHLTVLRSGRVAFDGSVSEARAAAPSGTHELETSDDAGALELAAAHPGVSVTRRDGALRVAADGPVLDALVLSLAGHGIAVRRLVTSSTPLQALYAELVGS